MPRPVPTCCIYVRVAVLTAHSGQLTQARTQFEHYQDATGLQRKEERQAQERRIAQQDHELDRMRQHVSMLQSSAAEHRGQLAAVVAEKDLMREDLRAGQQAIAHMQAERDLVAREAAQLASDHPALLHEHNALLAVLSQAGTEAAVHARELALANARLAELEQRLGVQAHEVLVLVRQLAAAEAALSVAARISN
jgi:chromosome segregation ATPase